jgi:hypothetical protein
MAFGLSYILGHSTISLPVREYLAPTLDKHPPLGGFGAWVVSGVECPACSGWHIGFWFGLLAPHLLPPLIYSNPFNALTLAFYTSGVNFVLGKYTKLV